LCGKTFPVAEFNQRLPRKKFNKEKYYASGPETEEKQIIKMQMNVFENKHLRLPFIKVSWVKPEKN